MKRLFLLLISAVLATCCSGGLTTRLQLWDLEKCIYEKPDSVLTVLEGINAQALIMPSTRALHSLLLSQALDLNYIDIVTDSIIEPATSFYMRHGSPERRMQVCYYQARVAENASLSKEAMEWLTEGEACFSETQDYHTAARICSHKSALHFDLYDYDKSLYYSRRSAEYALKDSDFVFSASRYLDLAYIMLNQDDNDRGIAVMDSVKRFWWDYLGEQEKVRFYNQLIRLHSNSGDLISLNDAIVDCRENFANPEAIPQIAVCLADAYRLNGEYEKALDVLNGLNTSTLDRDTYISALVLRSECLEVLGDYEVALRDLKRWNNLVSIETESALKSEARLVEERYKSKLASEKARQKDFEWGLVTILILGIAVLFIRYIRIALGRAREKLSETEMRFEEVERERRALLKIQKSSTLLDPQSMSAINERLVLLDKILLGHLSGDPSVSKEAGKNIERMLDDKDDFLVNSAEVFCASRPKFAKYLKEHGLTNWEIGYCHLFLMGMYSKDMDLYMSRRDANNVNATVRSKLGIPQNGKKLKSFLQEKFQEIESDS